MYLWEWLKVKSYNTKRWQECKTTINLIHCEWACKKVQLLWKTGNILYLSECLAKWPSNSIPSYLPSKIEISVCAKTCMWILFYRSSVYNHPNMKITVCLSMGKKTIVQK